MFLETILPIKSKDLTARLLSRFTYWLSLQKMINTGQKPLQIQTNKCPELIIEVKQDHITLLKRVQS